MRFFSLNFCSKSKNIEKLFVYLQRLLKEKKNEHTP